MLAGAPRRLHSLKQPRGIRQWLYHPGSLTQALRDQFGQIQVEKLQQQCSLLPFQDCIKMGLPNRQMGIGREVFLQHQGLSLVYAKTFMPMTTLVGENRHMRYWDTKPLGHYLFTNPRVIRSRLSVNGEVVLSLPSGQGEALALQRESIFLLAGRPILIYENYLRPMVEAVR